MVMVGSAGGGKVRIGIGGWTYEPWRGAFYPQGLPHAKELHYASRALTSLEINGTYYSRFKPDTWRKWRDETPDDFVFAVKASRYCTNRRELATAGEAVARFLDQGLTELGHKLGPINWQLMALKRFDAADIAAFLGLLPAEHNGVRLRHAIEARHPSFATGEFVELARRHRVAIVHASGSEHPEIEEATAELTYARIMSTREEEPEGLAEAELDRLAGEVRRWSKRGDVFAYLISGAKVRNPAAAQALMGRLERSRARV